MCLGIVLASLLLSNQSAAQDIHLSHIHASPTLLNPAMTGLFDGDIRFIANYRSQWNSITNGYRTAIGSVDMDLIGINQTTSIAGGLLLSTDKAGDLNFKTNNVNINLSAIKQLDGRGRNMIAVGFSNSFISNSVDYSQIVAFDAEPDILDGADDRITYWDFGAGLGWFYAMDRYTSFYVGTSLSHINKPFVSFFLDEKDDNATELYRKLVIHGGADLTLGKRSMLKPNFIFVDQGPHREINIGTFYRYAGKRNGVSRRSASAFYLGAWVRWYLEKDLSGIDAIVLSTRMDLNKYILSLSYDINISSWSEASYGRGGPEISFIKILDLHRERRKRHRVMCPVKF